MLTQDEADALISYMEKMSEFSNHQNVMRALALDGWDEETIDQACRALGKIAGRDFSVL